MNTLGQEQLTLVHATRTFRVSVVLPTLNEADNIIPLIEKIRRMVPDLHEVIVVDDDSSDGTAEQVDAYARMAPHGLVRVERRLQDHGLTQSLWHGITRSRGDVVVWMDCDFSMPPAVIPQLLQCIEEGYHIAVGSRFVRGGSFKRGTRGTEDSWLAVVLSRAMNYSVQFLLDHSFRDYTSGFAAVRKGVFKEVSFRGDYGEYFIDFVFRALRRGFLTIEVPYVCVPRRAGKSKTGQNLVQFLQRGLRYVWTAARLRLESLWTPRFPERVPNLTSEEMQPGVPIQVVPLRKEHVPLVAGLHHQVLHQTLNSRLGIPFLEALYGTLLEDPCACGWVALQGSHLIGFLAVTRDLHRTDRHLKSAVSFREKLFAEIRILSNIHDLGELMARCVLFLYVRRRFGIPYPTILTLGVSSHAQGKGVARRLVAEGEAFFFCHGIRIYYVDSQDDNRRACRFYERMGFVRVGRCIRDVIYQRRIPPSGAAPP